MLLFSRKMSLLAAALCLLVFSLISEQVHAISGEEMRTVFVIGDIADDGFGEGVPLQAWVVYEDQLILAETWNVETRDGGAVGLAVDADNEYLFLSFEFSDTIDVFSARDASFITQIELEGTSDLAGMVMHPGRGHLYVVDRGEPDVFVFDTSNNFALVDQWRLNLGEGAWGIDMLGDFLFISDPETDGTNDVRWFDIDDHWQEGRAMLPYSATGVVAFDDIENPENGPIIVTTEFDGSRFGPCDMMQRYAAGSGELSTKNVGLSGKGLSANPAKNLIYVAHGSGNDAELKVFDAKTLQILHIYHLENGNRPTDVLASPIPFGGSLSKSCVSHPDGVIRAGDEVIFRIVITNRSSSSLIFLPLQDIYDNTQLTFQDADPSPDEYFDDGQIDWSDLTISFHANLPPGDSYSVDVTFEALTSCVVDLEGSNLARIEDGRDNSGRPLFIAGVFDYAITCESDDDDDDKQDDDVETDVPVDEDDKDEGWPVGKVTGGCCGCE